MPRPPLRAVIAILLGWIGLRAWALWPEHDTPVAARPPVLSHAAPSVPAPPMLAPTDISDVRSAARIHAPAHHRAAPAASRNDLWPPAPVVADDAVLPPLPEKRASAALSPGEPQPISVAVPPTTAPSRTQSRLSGWAYVFARPGGGRTLAAGGQLGGSQVAARVAYRLTDRLSVAARAYAPLASAGAEAAVGADVALAGPVHAIVERRIGIDRAGRDAWSAYVTAGVYRERGVIVADAYAQAGIVGARRRDGFVDGAARAGLRVGRSGPIIGAGAWGAAQAGAKRLDLGPRIAWTMPGVRLVASIEGRFRVAGKARPSSGLAFTLARDF